MAVDVALIAIPEGEYETPAGVMSAKDICDVVSLERVLPGDDPYYDDDGTIAMLAAGDLRGEFKSWFYDRLFDNIEVGSMSDVSSPPNEVLLHLARGRKLTDGVRRSVMSRMSFKDHSDYHQRYRRGTGTGKRSFRSRRTAGWSRRPLSRWLRKHEGDWVIAELW